MAASLKIGFIGAGNLGKGLALALTAASYRVTAVASRTYASAEELAGVIPGCRAVDRLQGLADQCDLVFLTTPDDAIGRVAGELRWSPGQGVVHCSGTGSLDLLLPAARLGAHCGSLHPFQTLSALTTPRQAVERFQGVTFAVEADGWLLGTLQGMAADLGGRNVWINPQDRALYHASGVMSCGYLVALLKAAAAIWESIGFSEEEGIRAVMSMARATLDGIATAGMGGAVTGPMARGDVSTLRKQLEALETRLPSLVPFYLALSQASLPLAAPKVAEDRLAEMKEMLAEFMNHS